jgi:hypothetical protein
MYEILPDTKITEIKFVKYIYSSILHTVGRPAKVVLHGLNLSL